MFYSGIDQHKAASVITTLAADGQRVAQATVPNQRAVLLRYFAQFPGAHKAVVESTGRWYWLRDLLVPAGVELELAHAKLLKAIAYAKVKTDAIDADTLAQLLRVGLIPHAHMIADALRGPRDVLRARLELVTRRVRCEHSVGAMVEKFNVPDVGQPPPLYQLQARLQAAQVDLLDAQVKELEQAIQGQLIEDAAVQRLLWIPGIGRLLAFTLYPEIDDIRRFPTVRHFWSYCRLVPGADDLRRPAPAQDQPRRQPVPEARVQSRRRARRAVLPRGAAVVPTLEAGEADPRRARVGRERTGEERLRRADAGCGF